MDRSRRRLPRRWIAAAAVVLVVAGSERWGGPFTMVAIGDGTVRIAGAAVAHLSNQEDAGEIHITFDDGPHLTFTPQILDVLADHDAKAVFYPIGNQVSGGAELLRRTIAEGHRIGNHTWDHDALDSIDGSGFDQVVGRTQDAIEAATGTTPRCLRPPGGAIGGDTASQSASAGLTITLWTIDPHDWSQPGSSAIVASVLESVGDGDIVLLHDGGGDRSQTVTALDRILDELSDRGYRFPPLPQC